MIVRYRRHPNVRVTALDQEGVALHLDTHRYFSVNASGLTLLDALAEPRTLAELGTALVSAYDVEQPQALETARAFIEQCLDRRMVVVVAGT